MKKKVIVVVVVLVAVLNINALAETFYLRYISSGKDVAGSAIHTNNSKVYVTQTSNVNTMDGETGPKIHYGARNSNTTSGSSICYAMSVTGYSGFASASYKSGHTPSNGATVYLIVEPDEAASVGQWEIAGTWSP